MSKQPILPISIILKHLIYHLDGSNAEKLITKMNLNGSEYKLVLERSGENT